ncbi:MAG: CapA family protein [Bacteroidota bacterium]
MKESFLPALLGLIAVVVLVLRAFNIVSETGIRSSPTPEPEQRESSVTFLAVGDVNLGREVGQRILSGDTLFPFARVAKKFKEYDIVFANLECTLSDQKGETQHPRNNLIFTGPPEGAWSLKQGGVTVVSTANNHSLDYGISALAQTIDNLEAAGVPFVGTSLDSATLYDPIIMKSHDISIAFIAFTDVMNITDPIWKRYVASSDTSRLLPAIRSAGDIADFVVVSYHGGEEYTEKPTRRTTWLADQVVMAGADLFLGHHPHVPHGMEANNGKLTVYSLGNFVFRQPFTFWTQWSFAVSVIITKDEKGTRISLFECVPASVGLQPTFEITDQEASVVLERVKTLSNVNGAGGGVW